MSTEHARTAQITTRNYGLQPSRTWCQQAFGGDGDGDQPTSYIPSLYKVHYLWYRYHCIRVSRSRSSESSMSHPIETLEIQILALSRTILDTLLSDAKKSYKDAKASMVSVYTANEYYEWVFVAAQPKRSLSTVILDPGVKEEVLSDVVEFNRSGQWYADRGIPFRRGYLLYGPPGSGKTTLIRSIAGELGLDICIITLSKAGLDDDKLQSLISRMPDKCIALMEDIDVAFRHERNQRLLSGDTNLKHGDLSTTTSALSAMPTSGVSLSGLLNVLDGVALQDGRLLFATTNNYGALDPAICRPGRMDVHIKFHNASKYQAGEIFKAFFSSPSSASAGPVEESGNSLTTAGAVDGDGLYAKEVTPLLNVESSPPAGQEFKNGPPIGITVPHSVACELARRFSEAIPEREVSVAALQGYLMAYKTRPFDAVRDAPAWVSELRGQKGQGESPVEASGDQGSPSTASGVAPEAPVARADQ
ncbi:hypothetical protein EVJ58_g6323 [Rhodofomes roseus]|uniref:P-loop containing nucleoside triphosphate hydrolase protein n=1 Tax=Rhodofomes roseus TaxID=34475 RepID=A0A4Y9Y9A4_9APHY|nr:hypothetical protein EVJ58_g6323 [Rhodofomes roseus]